MPTTRSKPKEIAVAAVSLLTLFGSSYVLLENFAQVLDALAGASPRDRLLPLALSALGGWLLLYISAALLTILFSKKILTAVSGLVLLISLLAVTIPRGALFPAGLIGIALVALALFIFPHRLRGAIDDHVRFTTSHILTPALHGLGFFIVLLLAGQTYLQTQRLTANFHITFPPELVDFISGALPQDLIEGAGEQDSKVQGAYIALNELTKNDDVRRQIESTLLSQGLPIDIVQQLVTQDNADPTFAGEDALAGGIEMVEVQVNDFLRPYFKYIPLLIAFSAFMLLHYVDKIIIFAGVILIWLLLKILGLFKIITTKVETVEVRRFTF